MSPLDTSAYYARSSRARYIALLAISLGTMLGPYALSTVNLALPTIAIELNADVKLISWIPTGFLLSSVMVMLPMGKFADIYGRKRFYFLGVLLTGVLSGAASLVNSVEWLLFWRILQGVSMSMIFASGFAIVMSIFSEKNRGLAIGIYSSCVYVALSVSPAIGGWLTEYLGWRSVFWTQVPIAAVSLALILFALPGEWRVADKKRFDWTGSMILAVWAVTFVYGLAGLPGWTSIITLIISVGYMMLFIWHQTRIPDPLLPVHLFTRTRMFPMSLAAGSLMYMCAYPMSFLLSLFLQFTRGLGPAEAGWLILIPAVINAVLSPIAGKASDHLESRVVASIGCVAAFSGFWIMSQIQADSPEWMIIVSLASIGIGYSFFSIPNSSAAMSAVNQGDLGAASGALNLARTIGNLVGMSAVMLIVFTLIGSAQLTVEVSDELARALHTWLYVAMVFAGLSLLLSLSRGTSFEKKTS